MTWVFMNLALGSANSQDSLDLNPANTKSVEVQGPKDELHPILLEAYKPVYGMWGNPYTKIQMSFQVKLMEESRFYFGYTQLMLWNLLAQAPFFYDVNYNPLVWYRAPINLSQEEWLDVIPEEHESNGQGYSGERSWDRMGLDYHRKFDVRNGKLVRFDFKMWYAWHLNQSDTDPTYHNPGNTDLEQYRGTWEATLNLENPLGSELGFTDLTFRLYPGGPSTTNPLAGGQELSLKYRGANWHFKPVLVIQLFNGYAEDLLVYNVQQTQLRAGIGF